LIFRPSLDFPFVLVHVLKDPVQYLGVGLSLFQEI